MFYWGPDGSIHCYPCGLTSPWLPMKLQPTGFIIITNISYIKIWLLKYYYQTLTLKKNDRWLFVLQKVSWHTSEFTEQAFLKIHIESHCSSSSPQGTAAFNSGSLIKDSLKGPRHKSHAPVCSIILVDLNFLWIGSDFKFPWLHVSQRFYVPSKLHTFVTINLPLSGHQRLNSDQKA